MSKSKSVRCSAEALEARTLLFAAGDVTVGPQLPANEFVERVAWGGAVLDAMPDSWVITLDDAMDDDRAETLAAQLAADMGLEVTGLRAFGRGRYVELTTPSPVLSFVAVQATEAAEGVKWIEPNLLYETHRVPNDPRLGDQWVHLNSGQFVADFPWFFDFGTLDADIDSTEAWDITIGSPDVAVAIIDTGIDIDHPDLADNLWVNPGEIAGNGLDDDSNGFVDDVHGYDFGELDGDPDDVDGHGTGSAGLVGAVGNNGVGITGVAWDVSLVGIKIADRFGRLSSSAIVAAHDYLTMMIGRGHNIVASNNSYGAFAPAFYDDFQDGLGSERDAIERFIATGATFVASAGNNANDNDSDFASFPATYSIPGLISVAATDPNDAFAPYSNFGAQTVDIGAPGTAPGSTAIGGGYQGFGGTSAAGPVVAGAVALLKTLRPEASGEEVRRALIESADVRPQLQGKVVSGGRLNVARALQIIGLDGPIVTAVSPGPVTGQIDGATGDPLSRAIVTLNKAIDGDSLSAASATLVYAGSDSQFGTGDDTTPAPITAVRLVDATLDDELYAALEPDVRERTLVVDFDASALAQGLLPQGAWRLTLLPGTADAPLLADTDGNLLNGNALTGAAHTHDFQVIAASGSFEPNDTLATATPVIFDASGQARYTGLFLGDGSQDALDVDLFRLDLPRGGLISVDVDAKNLAAPSTLDSYVRLFNARGEEIANNDQADGFDSALDFFVTTGGAYYVGVSGYPNREYDPELAGSGVTQSRGSYALTLGADLIEDSRLPPQGDTPTNPVTIPDDGILTIDIPVNDGRGVIDANFRLSIDHPFVSDLRISLRSPAGTEVLMFNRHGDDGEDFTSALFDDEAVVAIDAAPTPYTGPIRPNDPLNAFDGESAGGTWQLVIEDVNLGDSGAILSWALELTLNNDIFGPFELNDTLDTANELTTLDGGGVATRDAVIGDGGFGLLDRDIFSFTAEAGATLNASAVSQPSGELPALLDTQLRLFDAEGVEIVRANPTGTLNADINNFVFAAGGIYYLAVGEAANADYDPRSVSSGATAATTGAYTLSVTLTPGVSDGGQVLSGVDLRASISADGTFRGGAGGGSLGIEFGGVEVLEGSGGAGQSFFGALASGDSFLNDGTGSAVSIPVNITNQSDSANLRASVAGDFRGLTTERVVSFGRNDDFLAIDITLRNTTPASLQDVAWMEAFDPSQGIFLDALGPATNNDINGALATASVVSNQYPAGFTVGLAAPTSDTRAAVHVTDAGSVTRDPSQLLAQPINDPNGASSDSQLSIVFDIGTLQPGQTVTMRYFMFFATTPDQVAELFAAIDDGSGLGHLAANPAEPAPITLSDGTNIPSLPYRSYFPEGFAASTTSHFLPMINPHDQATRVLVIARYEDTQVERDALIADFVIDPQQRGGVTITTPELFEAGQSLVRTDLGEQGFTESYAVEVWSERPITATFSYYDEFIAGRSALGEALVTNPNVQWMFPQVQRGGSVTDVITFQSTSDEPTKVQGIFFGPDGQEDATLSFTLEPRRRGGWNLADVIALPAGSYGMVVTADRPIVAAQSTFSPGESEANGSAAAKAGLAGLGASAGVLPEGQFGLNAATEQLAIVNPSNDDARVDLAFIFTNGATYRSSVEVDRQSHALVNVNTLPAFPAGQPYGVAYEASNAEGDPVAVAVAMTTDAFNETLGGTFAAAAYPFWAFGEGFRPQDPFSGNVTEYLRLYNPSQQAVIAEVTIRFDGTFAGSDESLGQETFRYTLPARGISEINVHDLVTGGRREQDVFYGVTIKAGSPIVAYTGRFDAFFPGAFGSLGAPLGAPTLLTDVL